MRLHAIVIDTALLGSDAWTYLEQLCGQPAAPAVVICTGPSSVAQRVRGLRLGADDWVTKPCHPEELIARLEAVARRRRRSETPAASIPVTAGEIEVAIRDLELPHFSCVREPGNQKRCGDAERESGTLHVSLSCRTYRMKC